MRVEVNDELPIQLSNLDPRLGDVDLHAEPLPGEEVLALRADAGQEGQNTRAVKTT